CWRHDAGSPDDAPQDGDDAVAAHAACGTAAPVRPHRLFAAARLLTSPRPSPPDRFNRRFQTMTYQNFSLKQLQDIDAAHHLHPFTDHKDLRTAGSRMITRANGPFVYDSEGNE